MTESNAHRGVKAAPGLARDAVPPGWELEFIALGRELKEAAAWSPALATAATRATILPGGHSLTPGPGAPVPVRGPGRFLLVSAAQPTSVCVYPDSGKVGTRPATGDDRLDFRRADAVGYWYGER